MDQSRFDISSASQTLALCGGGGGGAIEKTIEHMDSVALRPQLKKLVWNGRPLRYGLAPLYA